MADIKGVGTLPEVRECGCDFSGVQPRRCPLHAFEQARDHGGGDVLWLLEMAADYVAHRFGTGDIALADEDSPAAGAQTGVRELARLMIAEIKAQREKDRAERLRVLTEDPVATAIAQLHREASAGRYPGAVTVTMDWRAK